MNAIHVQNVSNFIAKRNDDNSCTTKQQKGFETNFVFWKIETMHGHLGERGSTGHGWRVGSGEGFWQVHGRLWSIQEHLNSWEDLDPMNNCRFWFFFAACHSEGCGLEHDFVPDAVSVGLLLTAPEWVRCRVSQCTSARGSRLKN